LHVYIFILLSFGKVDHSNFCDSLINNFNLSSAYKNTNKEDTLKQYAVQLQKCHQQNDDLSGWIRANKIEIELGPLSINGKILAYDSLIACPFFQQPRSKKDKIARIGTYVSLANNHRKVSDYIAAQENYEIASSLFADCEMDLNDYNIVEYCLKPLGNIYTRFGDYEKTIQTFEIAEKKLSLFDAVPDNFASLYFNWGNVYDDLEEYDKLVTLYERALNIKGISNLYKCKLGQANVLGRFHKYRSIKYGTQSDNLEKAVFYDAQQAFDKLENLTQIFKERIKDKPADAYNFLYGIYSLRAEIGQEFKILSKNEIINLQKKSLKAVKKLKSENPNAREIAQQHYIIGETYLHFEETDSAKHHFYLGLQTILPKYNPKQNPLPNKSLFFNENAIFENLEGLAEVFTIQDSLDLALQAYELGFYVKLNLRSIYDFESSRLYLQQEAKAVNSKAIKVAYQLYQASNDKKYIERAFTIAESSRALILLEGIMQNNANEKTEDSKKLAQQKAKFDKPISIAELQNNLANNQTLIEYFQADSFLYVFKIEKNKSPEFYKLKPDLQQLDELLAALRFDEVSAKNYATNAFNVYQNILAPLKIASKQNTIIVPDGKLNFLPFEALVTQASAQGSNKFSEQQYLIKNHQVSYQYSATIFNLLLNQVNEAQHNEVLAIAPVFEETAHNLKYSEEEVSAIAKLFSVESLMKNLAHKTNILPKLNLHKVLHFCTHASGGGDSVNKKAHIILYNDTLFLEELYQQKINANLTVLSACETNVGKYEGGEGVMSLSRAFAYAGCPSLVSTLWQVNEKSTKEIIVEFYKNLKQGNAKDEALQKAKLHYLKNSEDANPYYWASLVAIGNTQPLQTKSYSKLLWLMLPVGLGVLMLLGKTKPYSTVK